MWICGKVDFRVHFYFVFIAELEYERSREDIEPTTIRYTEDKAYTKAQNYLRNDRFVELINLKSQIATSSATDDSIRSQIVTKNTESPSSR